MINFYLVNILREPNSLTTLFFYKNTLYEDIEPQIG